MIKFTKFKGLGVAFGCVALVLGAISTNAEDSQAKGGKPFLANGGTTFVVFPTSNPDVDTHTIDGVVRFSSLGDCQFHATVNLVFTAPPSLPFFANELWLLTDGVFTITTADGSSTLTASAKGTATLNPNLYMLDIHYDVTFTGGTGRLAGAHGTAELEGFAMFTDVWVTLTENPSFSISIPTSDFPGKACWLMHGDLDY